MSFSGKHIFGELNGTRVTFVEKAVSEERMNFLKNLLEFNGHTVIVEEEKKANEDDATKYTVAVTDVVFNPVIAVYERLLKLPDGRIVTPDYWFQKTSDTKPQYWESMWIK
jgi:hypothetical protein